MCTDAECAKTRRLSTCKPTVVHFYASSQRQSHTRHKPDSDLGRDAIRTPRELPVVSFDVRKTTHPPTSSHVCHELPRRRDIFARVATAGNGRWWAWRVVGDANRMAMVDKDGDRICGHVPQVSDVSCEPARNPEAMLRQGEVNFGCVCSARPS